MKGCRLMIRIPRGNIEGTGVGMALVARIIDSNGGKMEIDGKLGKGSVFKAHLKV